MRIKIRKPNKYCRLFGVEIEYEKQLSDAETRLYHLYLRIVDWDVKHGDIFGSTDITIRRLREHYLPSWSIGKISYTRQSLIEKKWLEKRSDGSVGVVNFLVYRIKHVQSAEHLIQQMRQGVPITEKLVQCYENKGSGGMGLFKHEKAELSNKFRFPVQLGEQRSDINKLKEN